MSRYTVDPPILLCDWVKDNIPSDEMFWKEEALSQFEFFRKLIYAVCSEDDFKIKELRNFCEPKVISIHTSKSIHLPVVELCAVNGVVFTIRDNFHDYKISVSSPFPIKLNFSDLIGKQNKDFLNACYFEGFPPDRIFGTFEENNKQFSVELFSSELVFTLLRLISRQTSPF